MSDPQPRPTRPRTLTRRITNAAVSLQKTLTGGTDDHGDISTWNPALGEALQDVTSLTRTPASSSERNGTQMALGPNKNGELGWRRYVKYFTPSWFTVTMGTGIVASLLNQFPYGARWLYWLSVIVFCLNIGLYVFFLFVSVLQFVLFPQMWITLPERPNQAFFLSAIPMSLGTIVNMMVFVCVPAWGEWVIYLSWGLWMADAALCLICALFLPFLLVIGRQEETPLSTITALQMFPVIGTVVASATAALVANVLPNNQQALATVLAGYILLGVGLPTAIFILIMYWQRLTIHKLPPREVIVSCFVPLGPFGMGSFSIMKLGSVAMKVFPQTESIHPLAGDLAYNFGVLFSLIMWGFTLLWLFLAVATIYHAKSFPFNMGWWGFTFPIGTFALACNSLASDIPSEFFRVIGSMVSVSVFLLWLLVAYATLRDVITGGKRLFKAPTRQASKINDKAPDKFGDGEKLV
ncbi:Sulfite efflux pump SSU1 [Cladophialophora carrionii]|uniref:Sulfite efflux pump SSU1 n=1 Tax=Cladophialophora carrionii TaxID=86049 RepID=A0A1C1CDR2_9EURO|nr:Sulfite efflux pump SSU1 [Cladophialophora carrionii]